ncbi:MAG TPA: twin-arginine translocase TatA/TatE family subunit [Acidimicrobiales bacterium]
MLNLDPGKLLVIGVVAIILLGPDRLPQVARQIGGAWRAFNEFRHRMETQVRETMPDLPDTSEIARLARSPSALLNHLSNMAPDEEPDGSFQPPNLNGENGNAGAVANGEVADATVADATAQAPAAVKSDGESNGHVPSAQDAAPAPIRVERPPRAPKPSGVVVPGDPTLN